MPEKELDAWINQLPGRKRILSVFSEPKTLKNAERELGVKKLTLKWLIRNNCLACLSPLARKGRFYILTPEARECLNLKPCEIGINKDWDCIGWIVSSPRMRLVVLRSVDNRKLYSGEIRARATQLNSKISRTWTRNALKQLEKRNLVKSELIERIRFYWITEYGQKIKDDLAVLAPLAPEISEI